MLSLEVRIRAAARQHGMGGLYLWRGSSGWLANVRGGTHSEWVSCSEIGPVSALKGALDVLERDGWVFRTGSKLCVPSNKE